MFYVYLSDKKTFPLLNLLIVFEVSLDEYDISLLHGFHQIKSFVGEVLVEAHVLQVHPRVPVLGETSELVVWVRDTL